jgi:superfamily I DNA and/or RNA helicase
LAELENNPTGMMEAVSTFSFAFSSTIQQSVREELRKRKGLSDNSRGQILEYEYVILDEVARISPRDLMIGLAQGRRVILVGDHRQLPHIIDQEVERRMEAGESGDMESEWLKKSAFEYLFNERIPELERRDYIQRRVTLDQQFRMHPILGDFVSRNFYERFNPAERFTSGLPAEHFHHDLPGTNGRAAMWIDVPGSVGPAMRSGTSWTRVAEAEVISRQLAEWLNSSEGAGMTFGVISFYKAQAELIAKRLRKAIGNEPFETRRVRVGTVDSFQGMEFDVTFLSVVRTMVNSLDAGISPERNARRAFGHLCLYNRLNVSMSRQKKLLVVVGDPALVGNKLAAEYIPGLVDFRRLAS